jgi:hypothetical protein
MEVLTPQMSCQECAMQRTLTLLCFVMLSMTSLRAAASDGVELSYSGFDFHVPSGSVAVASNGGQNNFLVLRYGAAKGKQYLAFTDMTRENAMLYGCKPVAYYPAVLGFTEPGNCNQMQIESFRQVFLQSDEKAVWQNNDEVRIFYTESSGMRYVFVLTDRKVIKIDTDFMSIGELQRVVFNYLN